MHLLDHFDDLVKATNETPGSYAGFWPTGDAILLSKHRESTILETCNFDMALETLKKLGEPNNWERDEPPVYTFRASHWAVGWVEYLVICGDSPYTIKEAAASIHCALESYPVLDDEYYSQKQDEEVLEYWERASIRERVEWCKDASVSIFAARSDDIPETVYSELSQSEIFF